MLLILGSNCGLIGAVIEELLSWGSGVCFGNGGRAGSLDASLENNAFTCCGVVDRDYISVALSASGEDGCEVSE